MKRSIIYSSWLVLLFFALIVSCVKEGPQGPAGADGMDGVDGVDGVDGTATCAVCHASNTDLYAKQVQYEASVHKLGGNFERNGTRCASCHTHEGFMERMMTDPTNDEIAAAVSNPTPVNCRTCHKIHQNYDLTDYELTYSEPVTLFNGGTVDFGNGNLCINCHQSRRYEIPVMGSETTEITYSRWGTHHGPQSAMIFGLGGFEIEGSVPYPEEGAGHQSVIADGCISCHMAEAFGNSAGGHTFNMTYQYHGGTEPNIVSCTGCHAGAEDFNLGGAQDDIEALLAELEQLLIQEGVINTDNGLWNPGTYPTNVVGAALNFRYVEEDRSLGVHNYRYARALLVNAIEAIQ